MKWFTLLAAAAFMDFSLEMKGDGFIAVSFAMLAAGFVHSYWRARGPRKERD